MVEKSIKQELTMGREIAAQITLNYHLHGEDRKTYSSDWPRAQLKKDAVICHVARNSAFYSCIRKVPLKIEEGAYSFTKILR